MKFQPNYQYVVQAARNQEAARLPLYEHNVSYKKIGEIMGKDMESLYNGDDRELEEFFTTYCGFFKDHG